MAKGGGYGMDIDCIANPIQRLVQVSEWEKLFSKIVFTLPAVPMSRHPYLCLSGQGSPSKTKLGQGTCPHVPPKAGS